MILLLLISFAVFAAYIALTGYFYDKGKFPPSLSYTYYWLEEKQQGLGSFFTGMMFICAFGIIPPWIEATDGYWTALPFLAVVGIGLVASAPFYRDKGMAEKIHVGGADLAAGMSFIWALVSGYWYVWLVTLFVVATVAGATETYKSSKTWHLEMLAFFATYASLILKYFFAL